MMCCKFHGQIDVCRLSEVGHVESGLGFRIDIRQYGSIKELSGIIVVGPSQHPTPSRPNKVLDQSSTVFLWGRCLNSVLDLPSGGPACCCGCVLHKSQYASILLLNYPQPYAHTEIQIDKVFKHTNRSINRYF